MSNFATVTGNVKDLTGTTAGSTVNFTLVGYNDNQPTVNGVSVIASSATSVTPDATTGAFTVTLYGNDVILAGGQTGVTFYKVSVKSTAGGGGQTDLARQSYTFNSNTSYDLSNATPITTSPVVASPTGDTTYARLDGGNAPFTGQVVGKNGTAASPSFAFASDLTTGLFRQAASVIASAISGVCRHIFNATGSIFGSGGAVGWSSNADPSAAGSDTGISRAAANSIAVGNGTIGDNTGNVRAGSYYINAGGGGVWNFVTAMFDQISTGGVRWSSGANATTGIDTGVTRGGAAATVAIGNGTAGNASGTLKVAKLNNGADLALPTGAGTLALAGAIAFNKQIFTANGTFTIPATITAVKVTLVGGGGAGGGATTTANSSGVGGGSGATAIKWLTGLTPGNTIAVTVGTAGAGSSNAIGGSGGSSTIASGTQTITTVTAGGGVGGSATGGASGAIGGTATNGDINLTGSNPGMLLVNYTNLGSTGGSSTLGGGGSGGFVGAGSAAPANSGSGGGGAGGGAGGAVAGGAGGTGLVIFEWPA